MQSNHDQNEPQGNETDCLLSEKMIIPRIIPIARSTWWKGIQAGKFPKPVKVGRRSFWRERDIKALLENL